MSITLSRQEATEKFKKRKANDEFFKDLKYLRQNLNGDWHAFENEPEFDGVRWQDNHDGKIIPISHTQAYSCKLVGWDVGADETSLEEAKKQAIDLLVCLFGGAGCVIIPDGRRESSEVKPYYNDRIRRCGGNGVFFYEDTNSAAGFKKFAYTLDSGLTWTHGDMYTLSVDMLRKRGYMLPIDTSTTERTAAQV